MARHRIITLLGLTSLVATMVTITRYSSNFSASSGRFMPQQVIVHHQKPNFEHYKHDENPESSNLIDNINVVQSKLIDQISRVDSKSSSNSLRSSSSQSSLIVESINSGDIISKNQIHVNKESIPSLVKTFVTMKTTIGTAFKRQLIPEKNTNNDNNDNKNADNKNDSKNDFKIDIKNLIPNDVKNNVNIDVDQKSHETDNQNIQNIDSLDNEHNISKSVVKPKLIFDAEDLKTTESMKIDKPLGCDVDLGASVDLLVIVNSAVDHLEAREAIRKTWGKFAIERGAYLLFLIGSTVNDELQQKINAEDARFADILQGRYIDNYFNLTLKTISMMKWISEKCNKVKYVLKVDDDMFVNMQHITDFSETRSFSKVIIGKLAKKWKPHRQTSNKWYVPKGAFNKTVFPNFATGPAYIISGDAAKPLYETSIKLTPMYLEDVYMTGIVAERAKIRRLNHALMKNVKIDVNACNFKRIMTSHKHKPQDIIKLWDLVYNQPHRPCDTSAKSAKKSVLAPKVDPKNVAPEKTRVAAAKQ